MKIVVTDSADGRQRHLVLQGRPGAAATPLLYGAELSGSAWSGEPAVAPSVVVATGPDAGAVAPLHPGRWLTVGREPLCDIPIQDPSLSRRHLRIRLDRSSVRVEDLGSTNGIAWESGTGDGVWRAGDRLLVGRSALVLLPRPPAPATTVRSGGTLQVRPWRRSTGGPQELSLQHPPPPEARTVRRPSAWMWALPLVVGVLVAAVLRMPWLLLFGLLGPAMILGHHLGDKRSARLEHEEALARHRELTHHVDLAASRAIADDLARRRELDPALVGVSSCLLPRPSSLLWGCLGEQPQVVVGQGRLPSAVVVDGVVRQHAQAPVTVPLGAGWTKDAELRPAPLVLVGPRDLRDALARSLVLQLCSRHPPSELALVVDAASLPGAEWDLLGWLPHTRTSDVQGPDDGTGALQLLRWGIDLVLADDLTQAPAGLPRVVITGPHRAVLQRPGEDDLALEPSLLSLPRARDLARRLAPLRVETGEASGGLRATQLGSLLAWPHTPEQVAWECSATSLRVPLGPGSDGEPVHVDLAEDGPHALIAGTTGSGKSELLRTLITALALANSPADLSLLLVDFKGGASLGACASLPHVTGLVTDLDAHLAARVLLSLQAELTRRERVLHAAGVRDIRELHDLRGRRGRAGPGLPRLVVVIDEFRVLAEEVPEVMTGLVRVAAVGRSLGVHLILATQRPAGVVGADLRANVNLRIALRVRDAADSYDVLDCQDAAHLPEGRPGLALLRTGSSQPRAVQVAIAGPRSTRAEPEASRASTTSGPAPQTPASWQGWTVSEHPDIWSARRALEGPAGAPVASDPEDDPVIVLGSLLQGEATTRGLRTAPVWLPPLPAHLDRAELAHPGAWAVADLPAEQRRDELVWAGGQHLALVGSARSGRSTALSTLLQRWAGWAVVLDLGRSLSTSGWSAAHPRTCAWVEPDDAAHALRTLDLVQQVVQERQLTADTDQTGQIVLAVDGWDRLVDLLTGVEGGRGVEVAKRILREGPAVGVSAVVSGDRSLLLGAPAALFPQTWLLPLNDPNDLLLTGLRRSQLPTDQPPGRMVHATDGVHAQVVLPSASPGPSSGPAGEGVCGAPPLLCRPLPRRWTAPAGTSAWAVGGDTAAPVPHPSGSVLVLGPPRSGRTHALRVLAQAHPAALWVHAADPPEEGELRRQLDALAPGGAVVVDDAHLWAGSDGEELVVQHAQTRRGPLLVACDLDAGTTAFRGLIHLMTRARTALVLQPTSPQQGAAVGASLPVGDLRLPGRGVLVERGRTTRVQVVTPGPHPPAPRAGGGPLSPPAGP